MTPVETERTSPRPTGRRHYGLRRRGAVSRRGVALLAVFGAAVGGAWWYTGRPAGGRGDGAGGAAGEVTEVRLTRQYGLGYLPLLVAEDQHLIEKQARAAGLGETKVTWAVLGSGSASADALLSGSVDFTSTGVAPLVTLWAKSGGEVRAAAALGRAPMLLNTTNPNVRTVADFTDKDRIALPAVKVSIQAVVLQMAAAKAFGPAAYAKLDPLTVSMKHPDAMAALLSGQSDVTGHLTNDPYMFQELRDPRVHTVLNSYDAVGGPHTHVLLSTTAAFHDRNPKTYAAVVAAVEEAAALIRDKPDLAADVYLRTTGSKESRADVLAELANPQISFDPTPTNVMAFANFLADTGAVKRRPAGWADLFFPNVHHRHGS